MLSSNASKHVVLIDSADFKAGRTPVRAYTGPETPVS